MIRVQPTISSALGINFAGLHALSDPTKRLITRFKRPTRSRRLLLLRGKNSLLLLLTWVFFDIS